MDGTTILTLRVDDASQASLDALRRAHYPPELNRIAAHITLFHKLPQIEAVRRELGVFTQQSSFRMSVSDVMSLGRGVALRIDSAELVALHGKLASAFQSHLSPQDRQGFRPHVVVQNKVSAEAAARLLVELREGFVAWEMEAVGLDWWDYLGGPWRWRETFRFARS